jgi:DNA-directed RNA polymerase subunit RPC12/RpoP
VSNFSQACRKCGYRIGFDSLDDVLECSECGTKNLPHEHHTQDSIAEAAGAAVTDGDG